MKSLNRGNIAGNSKLRGKKTVQLCCGCCDLINFTESERIKEVNKEILEFNSYDDVMRGCEDPSYIFEEEK